MSLSKVTINQKIGETKLILALAVMAAGFLFAFSASAATYTVTTTDDENDGGTTSCTDTPADCSLREAIIEADNAVGADVISVPAGTFTLTRTGSGEHDSDTGDFDINETLTITGAGQNKTIIDGNGVVMAERVFQQFSNGFTLTDLTVQNSTNSTQGGVIDIQGAGTFTTTDVTFKDNSATTNSGTGGVINVQASNITLAITRTTFSGNSSSKGGAINANATTTTNITDSTFTDNEITRLDGNGDGGAIYNKGTLTVVGSTFSGNSAYSNGGAIASFCNAATAKITNSTFVGNSILSSSANDGGAAISSVCTLGTTADDVFLISHSTLVNNTVPDSQEGAGLYADGGPASETATITIRNSILSNNTDGTDDENCFERDGNASIISNNYNLEDGTICSFGGGSDQQSTDPLIDTDGLEDNGGFTQTVELQSLSPAVDNGICTDNGAATVTDDQRDYSRPDNSLCDIGAFELDQTDPVLTRTGASPVTHECAAAYTDAGGTATDNFHSSPTVTVDTSTVNTAVPGSYIVNLSVADYDSNTDTAIRSVTVQDTTDPVVAVIGDSSVQVPQNDTYIDQGATGTDSCDSGTFSAAATFSSAGILATDNPVDTATLGTYTVTYTATDASSNSSVATRTVEVVERGKVTKVTPKPNNKVKLKYEDGSTQTFTVFTKGTKEPRAKISKNGKYVVVAKKSGKKIKSIDGVFGATVSSKTLRKKKQDQIKMKLLNFFTDNKKNDVVATTRKGKKIRTTHYTLTKNGVLKGKDTKKYQPFRKNNYKIKKKKKLVKITKKNGKLLVKYKVTKKGNLVNI